MPQAKAAPTSANQAGLVAGFRKVSRVASSSPVVQLFHGFPKSLSDPIFPIDSSSSPLGKAGCFLNWSSEEGYEHEFVFTRKSGIHCGRTDGASVAPKTPKTKTHEPTGRPPSMKEPANRVQLRERGRTAANPLQDSSGTHR